MLTTKVKFIDFTPTPSTFKPPSSTYQTSSSFYPPNHVTVPIKYSYESEVDAETKNLNDRMKQKDEEHVNMIFDKIFNQVLVKYANHTTMKIASNEWCLNTELTERFIPNQILLVAHWKRPIRMLAVVSKASDDIEVRGVLPHFHYVLHKLECRKSRRRQKGEYLAISPLRGNLLYTTRRGCYAVNMEVFNLKLHAKKTERGLELREQEIPLLTGIYNRYIRGMSICIPSTFPRVEKDKGLEQFLLKDYPTKSWSNTIEKMESEEAKIALKTINEKRSRLAYQNSDNDDQFVENNFQSSSNISPNTQKEEEEELIEKRKKYLEAATASVQQQKETSTTAAPAELLVSEIDYFDQQLFDFGLDETTCI